MPTPVQQFISKLAGTNFFPAGAQAVGTSRFNEFSPLSSVLQLGPASAAASRSISLMCTPESLQTPAASQRRGIINPQPPGESYKTSGKLWGEVSLPCPCCFWSNEPLRPRLKAAGVKAARTPQLAAQRQISFALVLCFHGDSLGSTTAQRASTGEVLGKSGGSRGGRGAGWCRCVRRGLPSPAGTAGGCC